MISSLKGTAADRNAALRYLYGAHRDRITAFVRSNSGSEQQAKDLFQESIIAFYENVRIGRYRGESAIGTYIYSIAKFKWLNQLKKNQVRRSHHENASENGKVQDGPLARLIEGEEKDMVMKVLSLVGDRCKNLLIASIYHEMSMKEIISDGSYSSEQVARNKKYKCLKRLKEIIADRPDIQKYLVEYGK